MRLTIASFVLVPYVFISAYLVASLVYKFPSQEALQWAGVSGGTMLVIAGSIMCIRLIFGMIYDTVLKHDVGETL